MTIDALEAALYRIQLPVPLSNSTHGTMTHFELVTVRLRDSDGAEGVGYTYTTGAGRAAVNALIDQGLRPVLMGADADQIEALWTKMWWRLHYGGRGGSVSLAVSACDIALRDLMARRLGVPLWRLLGGFDPRYRVTPAESTSNSPSTRCCSQTDGNRRKDSGHQDEGGPCPAVGGRRGCEAMRAHLGDDFPLMADANMRWTVDQSVRAARAFQARTSPGSRNRRSRRCRGSRADCSGGRHAVATGENMHTLHEFRAR